MSKIDEIWQSITPKEWSKRIKRIESEAHPMKTEYEEAVRLARKHGAFKYLRDGVRMWCFTETEIAALIADVRRETAEECAKLCEAQNKRSYNLSKSPAWHCANAIRAKLEEGE